MKQENFALVVGADGLIGRMLADYLTQSQKYVIETTRRRDTLTEKRVFLDIAEDVSSWHAPGKAAEAYLCAAISSLEQCRRAPAQTAMANVHNTVALAKGLVEQGTFVVFPSTNLVYDGSVRFRKVTDPVCPTTEYGRQKAETERQLLPLGELTSVVRFTKVLGPAMPLFKEWGQALKSGLAIRPFSDRAMAPVPLLFAIQVLQSVAEKHLGGIVQVSGPEDVTYEQVARYIAQRIGASTDLIKPIRSQETGLDLEIGSQHTTLDTTRLREELGIEPPDVWTTIDSVIGL